MFRETGRQVLRIEADAIENLILRLDDSFDLALEMLAVGKGRVITTGMGKSGIICRKIAATLTSTGTPALFLHPAEAVHGDLGVLRSEDVVLALSNSGETEELLRLLGTLKRLGTPLISMVGNIDSTLADKSDIVLDVGVDKEACPFGLAPTASTTAALALGDALAIAVSRKKGFQLENFAQLHPGGKLGRRLAHVGELMHRGDRIPKVTMATRMEDVIYEMSSKGLGITSVIEGDDLLMGVISDGDLRRLLQQQREGLLSRTAAECMTRHPVSIKENALASSALRLIEQHSITSLMVTDENRKIVGVIHLHDLWGTRTVRP